MFGSYVTSCSDSCTFFQPENQGIDCGSATMDCQHPSLKFDRIIEAIPAIGTTADKANPDCNFNY